MEGKWLRMFAAACFAGLAAVGSVRAQSEGTEEVQIESLLPSPPEPVLDRFNAVSVRDQVELSRIAPGVKARRIVVDLRDGAAKPASGDVTAAGPTERLVYSNTNGRVAVDFGANRLISDDITITSTGRNDNPPEGVPGTTCTISRFAFEVDGRVNEALPGGSYQVSWALYSTCPYAVTAGAARNSRIILGSSGSLIVSDDSPVWIEHVANPATPINAYTNMWLAVQFNRANAGLVSGTPAQVGHTSDIIDFPGSACTANLGGYPTQPHASFNIEIWGNVDTCPEAYVAYKNLREAGSGFNAGSAEATAWLTDDITLQNACQAVGFTVGVRNPGTYKFELRGNCGAPAPIGGFTKTQLVGQSSGQEPRVFEYLFPNPVNVPQQFSFAVNVNNLNAGAIVTGSQAAIGITSDIFEIAPACAPPLNPPPGLDALHFSLICNGAPPVGACCDMFTTTCDGGLLDGELCDATAECQPVCAQNVCKIDGVTIEVDGAPVACVNNSQCLGGTCSSTCKEVPETNCPFPPRFTALRPDWAPNKLCANDAVPGTTDPFPNQLCGQSACCYENTSEILVCQNLTETQCDQALPLNQPRQWQIGRLCGIDQQLCPIIACLGRQGGCLSGCPHEQGCADAECCTKVCDPVRGDEFCCAFEWDCQCQQLAVEICEGIVPPNDSCGPTPQNSRAGATALLIPADFKDAFPQATALDTTDPDICCHNGMPLMCQSDDTMWLTCTEENVGEVCQTPLHPNTECGPREPKPFASLWYKFAATQTSHRIRTCTSSSTGATDSVIEVFAVSDPNATTDAQACPSLVPIACSDDKAGCGFNGKLSDVCVEGLTVGKTYYFLVGGKGFESRGEYRINIPSTPCGPVAGDLDNDQCNRGAPLTDGPPVDPEIVAFNMTGATFSCPGANCLPTVDKDLWYDYTAGCTGTATIDTCAQGNPATNLAVYQGCECPGPNEPPLACTTEGAPGCATVEFQVQAGQCYKIVLGNEGGNTPSGQLRVACDSDCFPGPVVFLPPNNMVDAGVPTDINDDTVLKGVDEIVVTAPMGLPTPEICFTIDCETVPFGGIPNLIEDAVEAPAGVYTLTLTRPLSPYAVTQIRYLGNAPGDPTTRARLTTHAGNVDGDAFVFPEADTNKLVEVLNGLAQEPPAPLPVQWGKYSTDIDRSGNVTDLDLLELMNILNGAGEYPDPNPDSEDGPHYIEQRPSGATCPL